MKILLHMGQGKTGTTALQQSLHAAADSLRARGILYPRFGGTAIAHHLLLPLCGDPLRLPAWSLNDLGGPEAAVHKAHAAWAATCDDLRSNPPDLLILSSELLLDRTDRQAKHRLFKILSCLSSDIVPIIYIRHPVDHYRSVLQELLKAESRPKPPVCPQLREMILDTEAAFPHPPALVAYDRSTLARGNIVPDFASRFMAPRLGAPDLLLPDLPLPDLPLREANIGLSAEALVLMARLRVEGGNSIAAARRVARLKGHLAGFDRNDPPASPLALYPDVAEAALRSATCHRWLAETGRLHIPGLDVARIDGAAVPDRMMTALPETMFPHDPERLARLRRSVDQLGYDPVAGWNLGASGNGSSPRLRDRLLRYLNRKLAALNERAATARSPAERPTPPKDRKGDS